MSSGKIAMLPISSNVLMQVRTHRIQRRVGLTELSASDQQRDPTNRLQLIHKLWLWVVAMLLIYEICLIDSERELNAECLQPCTVGRHNTLDLHALANRDRKSVV